MVWAPDSPDLWAPDSERPYTWAADSARRLTLGRAIELFLAAKAAESAAAKTIEWYRMILGRLTRTLGAERAVGELDPAELRAWIVELRRRMAPVSVAGFVRTLKVFGNWLAAEGLAEVGALRGGQRHWGPGETRQVACERSASSLRDLSQRCSVLRSSPQVTAGHAPAPAGMRGHHGVWPPRQAQHRPHGP